MTTDNDKLTLPQIIDDVKRAYKGYRVLSGGNWKFYATACLSDQQVDELESLVDEYKPDRKAA